MGRFDRLYSALPVWAQNGAVSGYGLYRHWLRLGPGYRRFVEEYSVREKFSNAEWVNWQHERLRQLLAKASEEVPYYRSRWSKEEKEAARSGDLAGLPLLEKESVRQDPRAFLRQDVRSRWRLIYHTSGSSGTPIVTYWTIAEFRRSRALREVRSARWAGVSFKMPRATISGRLVEPDPGSRGPFHRFNIFEKQAYFSAFHLRPETARSYVEALRRHRIQWMTGYAVSFSILAKFVLDQKLDVPPLKAVVTTSEKVTPEMRKTMEAAFGCPVFEEYSMVENALFASECEEGRLHVSPDGGVVEILRADGSACMPGEAGEVVATSFIRGLQPFIRYRLGDLAMWDGETCPCGRGMPVIREVVGRVEDVVIGPDGRRLVRFHGIFADLPHVLEGQVIQETRNRFRVRVVPAAGFDQDDVGVICCRMEQRLGPGCEVAVEPVEVIPRTAAGKFQAVVSLLHGR